MARPRTIDDQQILTAARDVFLRRGREAPTSVIAREAGVSEGSIFKRFATKDELFFAAMRPDFPAHVVALAQEPVASADIRDRLREVGQALLAFYRELMPRMLVCWTHPQCDLKAMVHRFDTPPPVAVIEALADLVARFGARDGHEAQDPEVVARALAAGIHQFVFLELMQLSVGQGRFNGDGEAYVGAHVDLLCSALRSEGAHA